jgi:hypothetical protein
LPGTGSGGVGINEIVETQGLTIFPNPFKDELNIAVEKPGIIRVYDTTGSMVIEIKADPEIKTLTLKSLSAGIYFLSFTTNETVKVVKIIKEN